MCRTNDSKTVCGQPLVRLNSSSIRFGAGCTRAMFRHLVRHSIQKNALRSAHWDDLAKAMYLVDGAGKSHGPKFEKEVPHRVVKSLQAKFNDMEKSGAVRVEVQAEGTSTHVYESWTQAWLLPEWDGSPANRVKEQCVKLLKAPDAHDANAAESDLIALAADDATIPPPANGPRTIPPQPHPRRSHPQSNPQSNPQPNPWMHPQSYPPPSQSRHTRPAGFLNPVPTSMAAAMPRETTLGPPRIQGPLRVPPPTGGPIRMHPVMSGAMPMTPGQPQFPDPPRSSPRAPPPTGGPTQMRPAMSAVMPTRPGQPRFLAPPGAPPGVPPPTGGTMRMPPRHSEQQQNARPPGEAIQELWDDLADGGDLLIELCCEILTLKRIAPLDDHPPAMDSTIKERMNEFHNLVMQLCEIEHRLEETYRSSATRPSSFKYPFKFLLWGYFANAVSSPATPLLWLQPESPAAA
ncbi:hypothetical protein GQ607_013056 [Colletotrichum asianum]|uniref:Uncharacterized protein n=1 Tax=Colletotrichum asianum TaxID=702518 RepID=A0A8H3ZMY2_9PEZI|nr:hypothetical protein GQ607_013056 [Colletotrichum asianum]